MDAGALHVDLLGLVADAALRNSTLGAKEQLSQVAASLDELRGSSPVCVEPSMLPIVHDDLDRACAAVTAPDHALAQTLREAAPSLAWFIAYDGVDGTAELEHFKANYAYTRLVGPGPGAVFVDDAMALGFTIQGANLFYPSHHHRVVEIYSVMSGTGEWMRNDEPWTLRPPGSVILHASHDRHAMRSLDEPILTWWAWVGDVTNSPVSLG